jgi:hypothetical protein
VPFLVGPATSGGGGVDVFGVGNVVLGMGGRRTGDDGTEGFEAKSLSLTDGFSEGIPDWGDPDEESVSDEDEDEAVGFVLPERLGDGDHVEPDTELPRKGLTSEGQTVGELLARGSDMLLRCGGSCVGALKVNSNFSPRLWWQQMMG